MFLVSSCSCLCPIHWSQVLHLEWICSWSRVDRWCFNYIWVTNNFIAWGAAYIRGLGIFEMPSIIWSHSIRIFKCIRISELQSYWAIDKILLYLSVCVHISYVVQLGSPREIWMRLSKCNFQLCLSNWYLQFYGNTLGWMPPNFVDKSMMVQVIAWCHQVKQAITWAKVDPVLWRHMASLNHNELVIEHIMIRNMYF